MSPRILRRAGIFAALLTMGTLLPAAPTPAPEAPPPSRPTALAEPPLWPIGLRLPDALLDAKAAAKTDRPADVWVWTPPGAKRVRALLLVVNNTDSKNFHEYAALRAAATRHEAAVIFFRAFHTGIEYHHQKPTETPPTAPGNILAVLRWIAGETGIAEIEHAPWITFGKSSRGEFPFRMGWLYPERTIAGITYHGESPTWPIPAYAKPQDQTILYVCANGQEEWDGTWYRHVRPSLLNYRTRTAWLPHQVVGYGVGHGNYTDAHGKPGWGQPVPEGTTSVLRIWDYLALFTDKALTLRLPREGYPTRAPLTLRPLDPNSGYLIHPRAIETLLALPWMALRSGEGIHQTIPWPDEKHPVLDTEQGRIAPELLIRRAAAVPEANRTGYLWIADREMVEAWLQLHNVKSLPVPIPE